MLFNLDPKRPISNWETARLMTGLGNINMGSSQEICIIKATKKTMNKDFIATIISFRERTKKKDSKIKASGYQTKDCDWTIAIANNNPVIIA